MKREIITTEDGSSSLFVPDLDETYHSIHGAITESQHVFIKKGFDVKKHIQPLRILEIGFGTGLNAFLTLIQSESEKIEVSYTGIEKYPINREELEAINYVDILAHKNEFESIHNLEWEKEQKIGNYFSLKKRNLDLTNDKILGTFDLVYFDAFAPNKQANMWTEAVFKKIKSAMNKEGLLVTYSCQGVLKRILKGLEFNVKKTDGPPGKREMLTAIKNNSK